MTTDAARLVGTPLFVGIVVVYNKRYEGRVGRERSLGTASADVRARTGRTSGRACTVSHETAVFRRAIRRFRETATTTSTVVTVMYRAGIGTRVVTLVCKYVRVVKLGTFPSADRKRSTDYVAGKTFGTWGVRGSDGDVMVFGRSKTASRHTSFSRVVK